jgi:hypothetical protein
VRDLFTRSSFRGMLLGVGFAEVSVGGREGPYSATSRIFGGSADGTGMGHPRLASPWHTRKKLG